MCEDIKPKLSGSNFGVNLKKAETDGYTFLKNELNYVGTIYVRTDENEGHPDDVIRGSISTFVPLCKGILLNENWALTTASCVKTFDDFYFKAEDEDNYRFGLASNHNLTEYHLNYNEFLIEILSAEIHDEYDPKTGHANLAMLKLETVKFGLHSKDDIKLFPGCLQDESDNKLNSLYSENVFYTMVNDLTEKYRRNYDFKHKTDIRNNLVIAENLYPRLIKVSIRELNKIDSKCTSEYFCADSKYKGLFCPTDNGSPLLHYNSKYFRLEIIGINDFPVNSVDVVKGTITGDNECRKYNQSKPITFIKIEPYLKWILKISQQICLTPELIKHKSEFCNCKNDAFRVKNESHGRIINGQNIVNPGDFSYVGYFSGSNGFLGTVSYSVTMFCTTVLLNRMFSLTTATCLKDKDKAFEKYRSLWVAYGGSHIKEVLERDKRHWRFVKTFYIHPRYKVIKHPSGLPFDNITYNDIGLIEHDTQFDYGRDGDPPLFIYPSCLQDFNPFKLNVISREEKETFAFSYALGYGHVEPVMQRAPENFKNDFKHRMADYLETYVDNASNALRRTNLKYLGNEADGCGDSYKGKKVFCFKKAVGKICKPLDLGGPLIRYEVRNQKFYVNGIAFQQDNHNYNFTHWHPCTDEAVMRYSNVFDHLEFIIGIVGYDLCWTSGPYTMAFVPI